MKTKTMILAVAALALLSLPACGSLRRKPPTPMSRTTTSHSGALRGAFGAGGTTVTEEPWESPGYTAAGTSLFAR